MAILQVRELDERLYAALKGLAKREKRSVSQEVIFIIEKFLANPSTRWRSQTEEFLQLSGAFENEDAPSLVRRLRRARRNGRRFRAPHGLFD